MFDRSTAVHPHDPGAVRVVDIEMGLMRFGQGRELGKRSEVAVHAEDPLRHNQGPVTRSSFAE